MKNILPHKDKEFIELIAQEYFWAEDRMEMLPPIKRYDEDNWIISIEDGPEIIFAFPSSISNDYEAMAGYIAAIVQARRIIPPFTKISEGWYYSKAEVAQWAEVNLITVQKWIERGHLPSIKIAGAHLINKVDLDTFLLTRYQKNQRINK